jgi:hypothetical protein
MAATKENIANTTNIHRFWARGCGKGFLSEHV